MNGSWDKAYKNMWDDRHKDQDNAYGKDSNMFLKEWLRKFES
jgi:hypothetical protein